MYVPYSMRDDEPDLYGGMGGYSDDDECTQTKWEGNGYGSGRDHELDAAVHTFRQSNYCCTQTDMTNVIQKNLEAVHAYRLEVQELLGLLSFIYTSSEKLPQGATQLIREQLTKTRQ